VETSDQDIQSHTVPAGMLNAAAAFDALCRAVTGEEEEPRPGFYTSRQWAEMRKKSRVQTGRDIADLLKAGKIERAAFRVKTDSGVIKPTPHYRLVTA
jgi:hypothetical protein